MLACEILREVLRFFDGGFDLGDDDDGCFFAVLEWGESLDVDVLVVSLEVLQV